MADLILPLVIVPASVIPTCSGWSVCAAPGEAKEADIGIAGGIGEGLIIKHGEVYKKVPEEELLGALRYELLHWK